MEPEARPSSSSAQKGTGCSLEAIHTFAMRLPSPRCEREKHGISEMLDTSVAVIDGFVDHLESQRSMRIRDRG